MNWAPILNIGLVILVTSFVVVGDIFLKNSTITTGRESLINLIIGIVVYFLSTFGFIQMYKVMQFSNSGVIYSVVSILLFVVIGLVVYKESVSVIEWIGIGLAVTSIILMSRFA